MVAPVEVREVSEPGELRRVVQVFDTVWGTTAPLVGVELLRAVAHTGGYVAGAYARDELVGASFGMLARHEGDDALHSQVTGVLADVRDTGVGRRLKKHQRAWAAGRGLPWVTWTFDPLVRRNAWFNLHVLGARAHEYLPDFYGPLGDVINRGDESDRLLVAWSTAAASGGDQVDAAGGRVATVATPADIVAVRSADPADARRWRRQVRHELGGAMAAGAVVVGFSRRGDYLLRVEAGGR